MKGEFAMEERTQGTVAEETGVDTEQAAAATTEGTQEQETRAETQSAEAAETGVKEQEAAAPEQEKAEKAFAARLAAERAKIEREATQRARDSLIAEQKYEWNGKPITTEAEYNQALREKEIQERLESQNVPPEIIEELVASRRDRAERDELRAQLSQQQNIDREIKEFQDAYPDIPANSPLPPEVWDLVNNKRIPLLDAYNRVVMPQTIAKMQDALKAKEQSEKNASTSPGSVNGNGAPSSDYISQETFEQNRNNRRWIMNNLKKITDSRPKWGG